MRRSTDTDNVVTRGLPYVSPLDPKTVRRAGVVTSQCAIDGNWTYADLRQVLGALGVYAPSGYFGKHRDGYVRISMPAEDSL